MENVADEFNRLENLRMYNILEPPGDDFFDEITALASNIFDVPIAIISLVDHDRIWLKSSYGLDADYIPKSDGLCCSAILSDDIYIVEDARNDPRTLTNPLVAGMLGIQFYVASPLISKEGYRLGTLCILDKMPRTLSAKECSMLLQLSRIVMDQFELKLQARILTQKMKGNNFQA